VEEGCRGPRGVGAVVLPGRRRRRRAARQRAGSSRGAHRRSGAARGAPADGPAFFSRSLAALGRDDAERRRARLYAVIEKLIADEPQGFARDETNIRRLCALAEVSRAGYYRRLGPHPAAREDADLRDLIHRIALADRHYGYRRVKRELFRQGVVVSYKRVARLMREDNLLALRGKPFVPRTTMSKHDCPIRPNLVRGLKPTGLDQIWVADITYVRLAEDFVYLAVILDAFSRKVVGWALADHLQASLALAALDMALAARKPAPDSLIHHSDRGVQYASNAYVERLESHGVAISMSRPANPYDNAKAESFMKTLKAEEVNGQIYLDLEDAQRRIGAFIETVYNAKRLHSALGYKPPDEFEAALVRVERKPINCEAVSPF
jgi:transposase InsO family protein